MSMLRAEGEVDSPITSRAAELGRVSDVPPISRLPDEIITAIFVEVIYIDYFDEHTSSAWIVVTHVCRRWRDLALSYSCLWASMIPLSNDMGCLEAHLHRSGTAPLTVAPRSLCHGEWREDIRGEQDPAVYQRLRLEAFRIRKLRLEVSNRLVSRLLETPATDAPILENLRIQVLDYYNASSERFWFLTESPLPALKSLELNHLPMSICHGLVRQTLTHLYVATVPNAPVADWTRLLARTPHLEILSIHGCVRLEQDVINAFDELIPPSATIPLSKLRRLNLTWSGWIDAGIGSAYLLAHLDLPAACSIQLDGDGALPHAYVVSVVASKLTKRQTADRTSTAPWVCSLALKCSMFCERNPVALSIWSGEGDMGKSPSPASDLLADGAASGPRLDFQFSCGGSSFPGESPQDVLYSLLTALHVTDATVLYLHSDPETVFDEVAPAIISTLPLVRDLSYSGYHPHDLLDLLNAASPTAAPGDPISSSTLPAPALPHLESLTLERIVWNHTPEMVLRRPQTANEYLRQGIETLLATRGRMRPTLRTVKLAKVYRFYERDLPWLDDLASRYPEFVYDVKWVIRDSSPEHTE